MLRKLLCASLVFVLCVAITKAEEIRAIITKVDADKGTITYKIAPMGKKGGDVSKDEITVKIDPKATFVKGKFDPDTKKLVDGDAIEKGLKDDQFTKIDEKGVRATITTSGTGTDTVATKVVVGGGGKRMKQE